MKTSLILILIGLIILNLVITKGEHVLLVAVIDGQLKAIPYVGSANESGVAEFITKEFNFTDVEDVLLVKEDKVLVSWDAPQIIEAIQEFEDGPEQILDA